MKTIWEYWSQQALINKKVRTPPLCCKCHKRKGETTRHGEWLCVKCAEELGKKK